MKNVLFLALVLFLASCGPCRSSRSGSQYSQIYSHCGTMAFNHGCTSRNAPIMRHISPNELNGPYCVDLYNQCLRGL